ncbi:MAG: hypothetical protein NZM00_07610 [Anaerolinea sp.]|nr:hypothetical protein [Anaerolinea sp.]
MIQRLLFAQLPAWARPDHPAVRYQRGDRPQTRRARLLRALGEVLAGGLLLLIGYLAATRLFTVPAGQNVVESINAILYFPLLALHLLARVLAVALTSGTIADEIRRQNWDNLRATEHGAELTLRARWVVVFLRLNIILTAAIVARLLLIGLVLYDLTAFQGRYIDLLINGITPEVTVVPAILLLALLLTASVLLPVTGVGLDAALGLLIATAAHSRGASVLLQGLFVLARAGIALLLTLLTTQFLAGELAASDIWAWLLMAGQGALADGGLAFLYLGRFGEIWAIVPYGIFLGPALVLFALMQSFLADRILALAIRRAQRMG